MSRTKILSLCDRTGIWSKPFADYGCEIIRVDLDRDGIDIRLMDYPGEVWGIIAQPPCTHLAGSGARWWKDKGDSALLEAMSVVDACLRLVAVCQPAWWVLENPVGRLSRKLGPPKMTFHPCEFAGYADDPWAEAYTKRTCLWGDFRFPKPKSVPALRGSLIHLMPPSEHRAHMRSVTPTGFARAFFEANHPPLLLTGKAGAA